ncbi:hypothetical protein K1719_004810 [Acacia pycnantha]|nr:hypothetical protein K1719_004810 [Acacia pycnantha]
MASCPTSWSSSSLCLFLLLLFSIFALASALDMSIKHVPKSDDGKAYNPCLNYNNSCPPPYTCCCITMYYTHCFAWGCCPLESMKQGKQSPLSFCSEAESTLNKGCEAKCCQNQLRLTSFCNLLTCYPIFKV